MELKPSDIDVAVSLRDLLFSFLLLCLFAGTVTAHDPGLSAVAIRSTADGISAVVTLSQLDVEALTTVDANHDGVVSSDELAASDAALKALAARALEVSGDSSALTLKSTSVHLSEGHAIQFHLAFIGAHRQGLRVRSLILDQLPFGHRQFLVVQDPSGATLRQILLDAGNPVWEINSADALSFQGHSSFVEFLGLCLRHILTGHDHLLFLL